MVAPTLTPLCKRGGFRRRSGYSLLELVIASGTGAILVAGLTGTLYVSTKAMTPDATASAENNQTSLALSQMTADLRLALGFTERTTKAVTFTVPDRTGDSAVETIRYSWTGTAGDPLLYQFNGGTAVNLATNVQAFNVAALTRTLTASSVAVPLTVAYQAPHSETALATAATSVSVNAPTGLVPGNLMIAAVAVDGSVAASLAAPSGWTSINVRADSGSQVTLGVWWKIATASEAASYSFSWTGSKKAYGWIMRFSGADSTTPINVSTSTAGGSASSTPAAPTVTTTVANAMIVRIGGFDDPDITVDSPGLSGHAAITMDRSDNVSGTSVSGGAGYVLQATAGGTGTSNFALTAAEEYVTFTIAINPEDGL